MKNFKDFALSRTMVSALEKLGFTQPTEIQAQSLPILLEEKSHDFHGQAQTGTGKTLAFGIPLLHRIDTSQRATQGLIVAPTRELVVQIYESLKPLAHELGVSLAPIYGGVSIEAQLKAVKKGLQIVVGTPGRLNDLVRRKALKLSQLSTLVLDEADIMLDMGFKEEIDELLAHSSPDKNIWLFSATVKPGIAAIKKNHMREHKTVKATTQQVTSSKTEQFYCMVNARDRFEVLCRFIASIPEFYGFIFCQTKIQTSEVAENLVAKGYRAQALHGDLSQVHRNRIIRDFKDKKFSVLVATDVAARGIDVADISHVINFQVPEDQESYVHRIGRTGRAGKTGVAITLVSPREQRDLKILTKRFNVTLQELTIPSIDAIVQTQLKKIDAFLHENHVGGNAKNEEIMSLVQALSDDQQKAILVQLLDEKFLRHINTKPLQAPSARVESSRKQYQDFSNKKGFTEFVLNMGSQDGISRQEIIRYLTQQNRLAHKDIVKVRVIKKRSFLVVPSKQANAIMTNLQQQSFKGRFWRYA